MHQAHCTLKDNIGINYYIRSNYGINAFVLLAQRYERA